MDAERLRELAQRLELLDERLTHKVRPRQQVSLGRATPQQLEDRVKDLSLLTLELKEILQDLVRALA